MSVPGLTPDDLAALNEAFDGPADELNDDLTPTDELDDPLATDQEASGDDAIDGAVVDDDEGDGEDVDGESPAAAPNPSAPASAHGAAAESPELIAYRQRAEAAEQEAQRVTTWLQQLEAKAQEEAAERQYREFMAGLEELDPEERETAKLNLVSQFAANILRQQEETAAAQRQQQEFEQAYNASFDYIANGNRLRPDAAGNLVPAKGAAPALTEVEKKLLRFVKSSAQDMQTMADELIANRQQRTAAARRALAEKRRAQGEGATGAGGLNRPSAPQPSEATSIDDFWNQHDAQYGQLAPAYGRRR